ncbi:hypothetical protein [Clostridium sp.]|uniref:hypothetical protein n=1 Tax=Clostridium sp. TaxID=1506 RepID=UPI0025B7B80E|nr:hypothetical protein [Clostridium sp.]
MNKNIVDKCIEYINDNKYLIYKKSLRYKNCSISRDYYLIIYNNEVIDILIENEVEGLIKEDRLSDDNIDLIVYKTVRYEEGKCSSFRIRGCIEYKINELIEINNPIGMFFCKDKLGVEEHFLGFKNRVVLKAKVNIDDLIGGHKRTLQFSKCIPLEVIE